MYFKLKTTFLMVKFITSGFYTTLQDFGRFGYQEFGVPHSGVMDRLSASFANSILGNKKDFAVLEITMTGPKLQFSKNTFICVSGANLQPKLNGIPIKLNKAIEIKVNDILTFSSSIQGFRCYLAILGGFISKKVMGSQSMYKNITKSFILFKNDEL